MSFFAILLALLIEQARPLARGNPVHVGMRAWMRWVVGSFDAGHAHHGWIAWWMAVALPAAIAAGVHWFLMAMAWPLALLWSVAVLYATLGFRQFSHRFTAIRDALDAGDEAQARRLLDEWQPLPEGDLTRSEIVGQVIGQSVVAAHRHVFGVLSWYVVLAALGLGPAGAVFFRLAEFVARYWRHVTIKHGLAVSDSACDAAAAAWAWVDWLPARITAFGFAVVGNFEDAIANLRTQQQRKPLDNDEVLLAATAGAINVRLGKTADESSGDELPGPAQHAPEPAHLLSIVGLVWRSVVMWVVLLALITLARLLG